PLKIPDDSQAADQKQKSSSSQTLSETLPHLLLLICVNLLRFCFTAALVNNHRDSAGLSQQARANPVILNKFSRPCCHRRRFNLCSVRASRCEHSTEMI
ncbi:uncharacterized, partial [Tachysurus ichikawai]